MISLFNQCSFCQNVKRIDKNFGKSGKRELPKDYKYKGKRLLIDVMDNTHKKLMTNKRLKKFVIVKRMIYQFQNMDVKVHHDLQNIKRKVKMRNAGK